jgi:transposase-like protein
MEQKTRKTNRKFTEEFKKESVELAARVGNSQAGRDLGINEAQIRAWKSQLSKKSIDPNKKSYEEIEKELKKVTKENYYLKEINKVLKKSTAIFSQDLMSDLK